MDSSPSPRVNTDASATSPGLKLGGIVDVTKVKQLAKNAKKDMQKKVEESSEEEEKAEDQLTFEEYKAMK